MQYKIDRLLWLNLIELRHRIYMYVLYAKMKAILTEGIGGYDKLKFCDADVPKISSNEVLLRVRAAGINNTDINTCIG